jgi:ABC-type uncharacterized transport system substrate-binding protein
MALGLAFALSCQMPASAHPHVFIESRVSFIFGNGKILGFRENWLFDEVFSDQLLQNFDTDQDGKLSPAESEKVASGTLPHLAEFRYFTYVWVDGRDLGRLPPSDFHASAKNQLVSFDFMMKLPRPVDPLKQDFALEINDHEYYIEVLLAKERPITFDGVARLVCETSATKDVKNAYYGGFVFPQQIKLKCR